jgi:hypothetical protein
MPSFWGADTTSDPTYLGTLQQDVYSIPQYTDSLSLLPNSAPPNGTSSDFEVDTSGGGWE